MEDRIRGRPSIPRHNQASQVAAREERYCSNPSRVIGARNGWSMKACGSLILTIKDVGFML